MVRFWLRWEAVLYRWYYALPWPSQARKRGWILWLHRHCRWLTRYTASFRMLRQARDAHQHGIDTAESTRQALDYPRWRRAYVRLGAGQRRRLRRTMRRWRQPPMLAAIIWAEGQPAQAVQVTLAALRRQLWPPAQLYLVGADTGVTGVRGCRSLEQALAEATADYVALLQAGDVVHETAFYRMAEMIRQRPASRMLYSDEEWLDAAGRPTAPYFKPDWNPDLMLTHHMVGQLTLYRSDLLTGLTIDTTDPAWPYDLALRISEQLSDRAIVHVPWILYGRPAGRDMVPEAAVKAVRRALRRRGVDAEVGPSVLAPGAVRVRYPLPDPPPSVSLIIPTRNRLELLQRCLDSLVGRTAYPNYDVLVIDNGSDEPATLAFLDSLAQRYAPVSMTVLRDAGPFNFSRLNNVAVRCARGELIGLLNNDVEIVDPDWLNEMVSQACRPEIGAVGARLLYPDGRLQHAGVIVGLGGAAGHILRFATADEPDRWGAPALGRSRLVQDLSAVTAACLVVRKTLYQEVGGLDETEFPVSYNDVDFCLKLQQRGYRNLYTPFATLYHYESASRGLDDNPEKLTRAAHELACLQRRWQTWQFKDPAYNPNFCFSGEDCAYSFPPRL